MDRRHQDSLAKCGTQGAHGVKPARTATGGLSAEKRAKFDEIDLHFHDLRHEAGSRKLEAGWPLHAVSAFLGHASIATTARYLNVKDDYYDFVRSGVDETSVRLASSTACIVGG